MLKYLLIPIMTIAFTINSYADVEFQMDQKEMSPEETNLTKGAIKGNNLKMDFYKNDQQQEGSMIYKGDSNEMIIVDHQRKTYMVVDQATMQMIASEIEKAMAEMEAAMKEMSPEQREMMEKMMKDKMPGMSGEPQPEPVMKKTGSDTVNGYSCTKYDVYKGEEKVRQHCVTDWGNIKGGDEMRSVMMGMADFMEQMMKGLSKGPGAVAAQAQFESNVFNQLRKLNGFPVQTIDYDGGKVDSESRFTSSEKKSVDASSFEPPADYKLEQMMQQ